MELDRLQFEVAQWANDNFGSQPPAYALVGAAEEIGETADEYLNQMMQDSQGIQRQIALALELQVAASMLHHSILKRTQGIREDDPGVGIEVEQQAINKTRMILKDIEDQISEDYTGREIDLEALPDPTDEVIDGVADTNIYLADFSQRAGIDMDQAVATTWMDIVSDRDWDSDLGDHDG
jgi:hypothetical protein